MGEIGLRMALGAQRSDILKIVQGEGASIIAFGVLAGLVGALMSTRFLRTMRLDLEPTDPIALGASTTRLALVALLACILPAQRASRVDALVSLRHEKTQRTMPLSVISSGTKWNTIFAVRDLPHHVFRSRHSRCTGQCCWQKHTRENEPMKTNHKLTLGDLSEFNRSRSSCDAGIR
jgi:hypothetical protein